MIVTSWVFREGRVDFDRLARLVSETGKERLVLDLSCRKRGNDYFIVTDRWQKFTEVTIGAETLNELAEYCDEFLVHAADVEGKCSGIEEELITNLADESPIPTTYAGGVSSMADLELIQHSGRGKLDVTIGSALDIFGGALIRYDEVVRMHNTLNRLA